MSNNVSVVIEVYNEEERIENCLKCFQWADEIIVFDKHSTDNTEIIALKYNARVVKVPYSEASENTVSNYKNLKTKKWILFITCSSMMHPQLAQEIIKLTSNSNFKYDVIGLPYKMYSLGINSKYSPWYTDYKYSLIKSSVMKISGKLHEEIQFDSRKIFKISGLKSDAAFYHFTNLSVDDMLQRIIRYTKYESVWHNKNNNTYFSVFYKVIKAFLILIKKRTFLLGWNGLGLGCAYLMYYLMQFLYFWEEKSSINSKSSEHIKNLLKSIKN